MTHRRKNPALRPSPRQLARQLPRQALRPYRNPCRDTYLLTGFSLVEVLVTIVILLIGLLGLAGLQARALTVQMEAYQRSQALVLLKDMADRIDTNRLAASCYGVTSISTGTPYFGTESTLTMPAVATCAAAAKVLYDASHPNILPLATATSAATIAVADMNDWHNALLGAAETQGTSKVGAMIGARGCVYEIQAPASGVPAEYLVTVAWQGFNSTAAPPAILCGKDQYSDEKLRRVVALPISIANLSP